MWALAEEPGVAHVVGRSMDVAKVLFEDVLALRVTAGSNSLKPINEKDGFIGDITRNAGSEDPGTILSAIAESLSANMTRDCIAFSASGGWMRGARRQAPCG